MLKPSIIKYINQYVDMKLLISLVFEMLNNRVMNSGKDGLFWWKKKKEYKKEILWLQKRIY